MNKNKESYKKNNSKNVFNIELKNKENINKNPDVIKNIENEVYSPQYKDILEMIKETSELKEIESINQNSASANATNNNIKLKNSNQTNHIGLDKINSFKNINDLMNEINLKEKEIKKKDVNSQNKYLSNFQDNNNNINNINNYIHKNNVSSFVNRNTTYEKNYSCVSNEMQGNKHQDNTDLFLNRINGPEITKNSFDNCYSSYNNINITNKEIKSNPFQIEFVNNFEITDKNKIIENFNKPNKIEDLKEISFKRELTEKNINKPFIIENNIKMDICDKNNFNLNNSSGNNNKNINIPINNNPFNNNLYGNPYNMFNYGNPFFNPFLLFPFNSYQFFNPNQFQNNNLQYPINPQDLIFNNDLNKNIFYNNSSKNNDSVLFNYDNNTSNLYKTNKTDKNLNEKSDFINYSSNENQDYENLKTMIRKIQQSKVDVRIKNNFQKIIEFIDDLVKLKNDENDDKTTDLFKNDINNKRESNLFKDSEIKELIKYMDGKNDKTDIFNIITNLDKKFDMLLSTRAGKQLNIDNIQLTNKNRNDCEKNKLENIKFYEDFDYKVPSAKDPNFNRKMENYNRNLVNSLDSNPKVIETSTNKKMKPKNFQKFYKNEKDLLHEDLKYEYSNRKNQKTIDENLQRINFNTSYIDRKNHETIDAFYKINNLKNQIEYKDKNDTLDFNNQSLEDPFKKNISCNLNNFDKALEDFNENFDFDNLVDSEFDNIMKNATRKTNKNNFKNEIQRETKYNNNDFENSIKSNFNIDFQKRKPFQKPQKVINKNNHEPEINDDEFDSLLKKIKDNKDLLLNQSDVSFGFKKAKEVENEKDIPLKNISTNFNQEIQNIKYNQKYQTIVTDFTCANGKKPFEYKFNPKLNRFLNEMEKEYVESDLEKKDNEILQKEEKIDSLKIKNGDKIKTNSSLNYQTGKRTHSNISNNNSNLHIKGMEINPLDKKIKISHENKILKLTNNLNFDNDKNKDFSSNSNQVQQKSSLIKINKNANNNLSNKHFPKNNMIDISSVINKKICKENVNLSMNLNLDNNTQLNLASEERLILNQNNSYQHPKNKFSYENSNEVQIEKIPKPYNKIYGDNQIEIKSSKDNSNEISNNEVKIKIPSPINISNFPFQKISEIKLLCNKCNNENEKKSKNIINISKRFENFCEFCGNIKILSIENVQEVFSFYYKQKKIQEIEIKFKQMPLNETDKKYNLNIIRNQKTNEIKMKEILTNKKYFNYILEDNSNFGEEKEKLIKNLASQNQNEFKKIEKDIERIKTWDQEWFKIQFKYICWKIIKIEKVFNSNLENRKEKNFLINYQHFMEKLYKNFSSVYESGLRSFLTKVYDKDFTINNFMILFISNITNINDENILIELTDGYQLIYSNINLNNPIFNLIKKSYLKIGLKIKLGMVKIEKIEEKKIFINLYYNCISIVPITEKLGIASQQCLLKNLINLKEEGGPISKIDIIILKIYPYYIYNKKTNKKLSNTLFEKEREENFARLISEQDQDSKIECDKENLFFSDATTNENNHFKNKFNLKKENKKNVNSEISTVKNSNINLNKKNLSNNMDITEENQNKKNNDFNSFAYESDEINICFKIICVDSSIYYSILNKTNPEASQKMYNFFKTEKVKDMKTIHNKRKQEDLILKDFENRLNTSKFQKKLLKLCSIEISTKYSNVFEEMVEGNRYFLSCLNKFNNFYSSRKNLLRLKAYNELQFQEVSPKLSKINPNHKETLKTLLQNINYVNFELDIIETLIKNNYVYDEIQEKEFTCEGLLQDYIVDEKNAYLILRNINKNLILVKIHDINFFNLASFSNFNNKNKKVVIIKNVVFKIIHYLENSRRISLENINIIEKNEKIIVHLETGNFSEFKSDDKNSRKYTQFIKENLDLIKSDYINEVRNFVSGKNY